MKATGIVRKVDELGRVVLPKEIRRTMSIKKGDYIEIYIDKNQLILKKYSPEIDLTFIGTEFCKSLVNITRKQVFLCDTESVVFSSVNIEDSYVQKEISNKLKEVIKDKKSLLINVKEGSKIIPLIDGQEENFENQIIIPIVVKNEGVGAIILADANPYEKFTREEINLLKLGAEFLSRKIN